MGLELRLMEQLPGATEMDDAQLIGAIRGGDEEAFATLVHRKTSKVYGICYRVVNNAEDAKDISQLAFVKIWEHLGKYDAHYTFDTWMYRIVTNVAIDFLRSRTSREAAVNSNLRLVKTTNEPDQANLIQRKEIESVFADVSSALSPKQKAIFVMREMEDISAAEISRILGCRESTVRNHLFNARKLMRQRLEQKYPEYARLGRNRDVV